jgi:hypothetical protein
MPLHVGSGPLVQRHIFHRAGGDGIRLWADDPAAARRLSRRTVEGVERALKGRRRLPRCVIQRRWSLSGRWCRLLGCIGRSRNMAPSCMFACPASLCCSYIVGIGVGNGGGGRRSRFGGSVNPDPRQRTVDDAGGPAGMRG